MYRISYRKMEVRTKCVISPQRKEMKRLRLCCHNELTVIRAAVARIGATRSVVVVSLAVSSRSFRHREDKYCENSEMFLHSNGGRGNAPS